MVVTLPLSLNGILPLTPAAVASTTVALLVLAALLCAAVGLLTCLGGDRPPGRRLAPTRLQSGRRGATALRRPAARAAGPQRASGPCPRSANWRPA